MRTVPARCISMVVIAAVAGVSAGCGQYSTTSGPADDEPMKRLIWENKRPHLDKKLTPSQAAKEWFLPNYYFDVSKSDQDYTQPQLKGEIRDYFSGMDRIAVTSAWKKSAPTLASPVFQLFDPGTKPPEVQIVDPLTTYNEVLGRNTWMMWCAGNEGFWDWLASDSLGFIDLLKVVDSRARSTRFANAGLIDEPEMMKGPGPDPFGLWLDVPSDGATRKWRENYLRRTFDEIRFGTHVSQRGLDRYQNKSKYPDSTSYQSTGYSTSNGYYDYFEGDANDAPPPPEIYGLSSGVVGLRLFPNPNFDDEARKKWDARRYYDPKQEDYWNDPELVRPYRVGMACAFCHASYHPLNPPRDLINPRWENISGNIGAQYLRTRAVFGSVLTPDNFVYHILDSQPPGTIDTSLIASDNINNPNAMNSVFNLPQRVLLSFRNPMETISGASATQPSVWRHPEAPADSSQSVDKISNEIREILKSQGLLPQAENSNSSPSRHVPRILLDGSDSIGAWGALARVYLNIGSYYEQWNRLHRVVVGFQPQKPFRITDCEQHSVYWNATQLRVAALRDYFLKVTPPMPLAIAAADRNELANSITHIQQTDKSNSAASGAADRGYAEAIDAALAKRVDRSKLRDGRKVFARNCIVCHSSIQPESSDFTFYDNPKERDDYNARYKKLIDRRTAYRERDKKLNEFWEHEPARWLADPDYIQWALEAVDKEPFWQLNFLSTDYRVPINLVNTNAGRAMATNAIDQNMWDDFASESYQNMPSVGSIDFFNPYLGPRGAMDRFTPRHTVRNNAPPGGGGVGFYRVPTLVSIWATAPLLHNNSLGRFTNDPSIDGRLTAFDDAIHKLLWQDRRLLSSDYNEATPERLARDHGLIWRTTTDSYLTLSGRRVPTLLGANVARIMSLRERYVWLKQIRPLWLPSVLFFLAALTYFLADPQRTRCPDTVNVASQLGQPVGAYFAVIAGLLLIWLPYYFVGVRWASSWLNQIDPLWLPGAVLLVVGIVLISLGNYRRTRWLAWTTLIIAAAIFFIYLRHAYPPWFTWLEVHDPLVLFSVILAAVGVYLVWPYDTQTSAAFNYGRIALALALTLCLVFTAIWHYWMVASHWLAALVALLLIAGVTALWIGDPQKSHIFGIGCTLLFLAILVYLLFAFGWFAWGPKSNHPLALLVVVVLLSGVALAWLGQNKGRKLGYAILVLAVFICLLHAIHWIRWAEYTHPLGVFGAVLLLLALILFALVRLPLVRLVGIAILFLAATSIAFSFIQKYPDTLPSYVHDASQSNSSRVRAPESKDSMDSPSYSANPGHTDAQSAEYSDESAESAATTLDEHYSKRISNYLQMAGPLWPFSVLFAFIAILFLVVHNPAKLARWLGYTSFTLGIVAGFLIYFLNGRLGDLRIGPIPKGTPVNLLANLNPDADPGEANRAVGTAIRVFADIESKKLSEDEKQRLLREKVAPDLMKLSKCPDLVMDKGHYFEWFKTMSDADKEALIELLKTF